MYQPDRIEVRDYLDLRDWLRISTADRELYAATKRRLARQPWRDMNDYADAKSEVIRDVLGRARVWRNGTRSPQRHGRCSHQGSRLGSRSTQAGERPQHRPSGCEPLAEPVADRITRSRHGFRVPAGRSPARRRVLYEEGWSNFVRSGAGRPVCLTAACRSSASAHISSGAPRVWAANHSSPRGLASTRCQ